MPTRTIRAVHRLSRRRATAWTSLVLMAVAQALLGTQRLHPQLGLAWDLIVIGGAIAILAIAFIDNARVRSFAVGAAAFTMLGTAVEFVRLIGDFLGWSVALLWVTALLALINLVATDQDVPIARKLEAPPEPDAGYPLDD